MKANIPAAFDDRLAAIYDDCCYYWRKKARQNVKKLIDNYLKKNCKHRHNITNMPHIFSVFSVVSAIDQKI